ncbi:MAG: 4Fe-4S dicluster domain-containing protein [Bacteroidetes bacterium]|nr:MAG: 4Fe-4S dicluster domain-containing protein [Bacteroidota bacterium]
MSKPRYWRGLEELEQTPEFIARAKNEFPSDIPMDQVLKEVAEEDSGLQANRRDFLKVLGFGLSAAALAACAEGPVKKAIPYVNKPQDIIPGVANWYASTAPTGTPVLVRTREGRPIKLEGNPDSRIAKGGLSAIGHASLLNLYETERHQSASKKSNPLDWDTVDGEIRAKLDQVKAAGSAVRVVSGSILSPTTRQIITEFLAQFADGKHISYDAVSFSAVARAHEIVFGKRVVPQYHFDKAMSIVSFSADFLGTWISPIEYAADYVVNRDPEKPMSRHLQFESLLTTTGAKADLRFPVNPSQQGVALLNLYNKIAAKVGKGAFPGVPEFNTAMNGLDLAATELFEQRGKSLLICGTNDVAAQVIVASINAMLGNYGATLDAENPSYYYQGNDEAFAQFADELSAGKVGAVIFLDANPVYETALGEKVKDGLTKTTLSVSTAVRPDETSALCEYVCPDHHYLESWGDAQQTAVHFSLIQPTIYPLFKTRQAQDSLLKWSGSTQKYYDYLKNWWATAMMPKQTQYTSFQTFWDESLRKGVMELPYTAAASAATIADTALLEYADRLKQGFAAEQADTFDLVLFEKVGIRDGKFANNPWLQELPDPVTKVSWDNYVTIPYQYAAEKGLKDGSVVEVKAGGASYFLPVVIQPGQAKNTLGIALGYGRTAAGKVIVRGNGSKVNGRQVGGGNVYPLAVVANGAASFTVAGATISATGDTYTIAQIQTFNTLYDPAKGVAFGLDFDRTEKIIEETTTGLISSGEFGKKVKEREDHKKHLVSLWDSHFEDPETSRQIHWKMAIDLNKCTGCGACVVACQSENNIPVVGKDEIARHRDMYWMRIDRYYSGSPENPDVVFQPMMCQHCDNAPCETVCPVLATLHSNEGLNQMVYPRCVGTRYCANNCPYKVRRFNWFNYWNDKDLFSDFYSHSEMGRLVLNPDVTVRFRGVMEKCSFCVQRLQEGKLRAKVNANSTFAKPEDGSIKTACQQSCPTGAIVFGDFNDPDSEVSKLFRKDRSYVVIEEVKTLPNVQYMTLVRNRNAEETEAKLEERHATQTYSKA